MSTGYDPELRRATPLAGKLAARIAREGPISVAEYMRACLQDEQHGYYRTRRAIGREGDFVTAPEISQIFGELIGLWAAVVWQQMGSPGGIELVELGPGRGTLLRDALRAARKLPAFHAAVRLSLVESSPVLRDAQRAALADAGVPVAWLALAEAAAAPRSHPAILLANEFLDAMPVEQHIFRDGAWHRRGVGLDGQQRLAFVDLGATPVAVSPREPPAPGSIVESIADAAGLLRTLFGREAAAAPLAALLVDYGHDRSAYGDTLQAVRDHAFEHVLTSPGEADLSAQVDFAAVAAHLSGLPDLAVDGPLPQGELLGRLGINERAARLMAANPAKAHGIEAGVARLMSPTGMGARFKALGVRSSRLPPLPGFAAR